MPIYPPYRTDLRLDFVPNEFLATYREQLGNTFLRTCISENLPMSDLDLHHHKVHRNKPIPPTTRSKGLIIKQSLIKTFAFSPTLFLLFVVKD